MSLDLSVEESRYSVSLRLRLRNTTDEPIAIETLSPLVSNSVHLGTSPERWAFYRTGWQSWSPTGATWVGDDRLPSGPPVVAPMISAAHSPGLTSAWAGVVQGTCGGALLVGFTTGVNQLSTIRLTPRGELWATCHLEGIVVQPGDEVVSETLLVDYGLSGDDLLQNYASEVAAAMCARRGNHITAGWCSWYKYFRGVREDDIILNLEHLKGQGRDKEIQVVQLDAGYESAFRDWLSVNQRFPHGLAWLAGQIREAGFKPGLWLAPFAVPPASELYRQHP